MNRRSFLSRSVLSAASLGIGGIPFAGRRFGIRSAEAAGQLPAPYPVLLIHINGGWDPAMQMVALPNGSFGNVTIENRLPSASSFKTTNSGITYVPSVITPVGNTQFEPHLEDVALIRAIDGSSDHSNLAGSWFGRPIGPITALFGRLSWASQLAAQFRKRGVIVPKPVAVAYQNFSAKVMADQPHRDLVAWGTESPDPATLADRITSISGYFDSVSAVGLPTPALQAPANSLIDALDQLGPLSTQPDYQNRFLGANQGTHQVLSRAASGPAWPPTPADMAALGLTTASVNKEPDLLGKAAPYEHIFGLAFQALVNNMAHVIGFRTGGTWDSHIQNVDRQTKMGNGLWPALGRLITLMKNTPSPINPALKLFDTTNIWLHSEIGRSPDKQPPGGQVTSDDGTKHWRATSVVFMGGRFKRGIAIGGFSPKYYALPVNPATGAQGSSSLNIENCIATVMKAAGGDPAEFTKGAPIDALLDMSRF